MDSDINNPGKGVENGVGSYGVPAANTAFAEAGKIIAELEEAQ